MYVRNDHQHAVAAWSMSHRWPLLHSGDVTLDVTALFVQNENPVYPRSFIVLLGPVAPLGHTVFNGYFLSVRSVFVTVGQNDKKELNANQSLNYV